MSDELTRRERKKAEFRGKFQACLIGFLAGPLLGVGGQTIVNGWNIPLVVGWTMTIMGLILAIISGGLAFHYWIEIDQT